MEEWESKRTMAMNKIRRDLEEATAFLDKHMLDEARELFGRVLQEYAALDTHSALEGEAVMAAHDGLLGLADVSLKHGHIQRRDALAWFHHYLCGLSYMHQAHALCQRNEVGPDGWRNCDITSRRMRTEERLCDVSTMFTRHLKHHLVLDKNTLNESWLEQFVTYTCGALNGHILDSTPGDECSSAVSFATKTKSQLSKTERIHKKRKECKERRMDFNKIQKAIGRLVRTITADIRSRYRRKKLSEETLRRSLSCEILTIMSPLTDDNDLVELLERVIAEEEAERGEGHSGVAEGAPEALDLQLTPAASSRAGSKRGSTDNLLDDSGASTPFATLSGACTPITPHDPSESQTLTSESEAGPSESSRSSFSVWKSYMKSPRPASLPFDQYRLSSFDQMAPLVEAPLAAMGVSGDSDEFVLEAAAESVAVVQPLTSAQLFETLSHMLSEMGAALYGEEVATKETASDWGRRHGAVAGKQAIGAARELYRYSLGLLHQSRKTAANTTRTAQVLKSLGVLECNSGDLSTGCQLLQEAMRLFRLASQGGEEALSVAGVWCELGRAFLLERQHVTSLFNHVMQEVRSELEAEFRTDVLSLGDESTGTDTDESETSSGAGGSGDSYAVHVHEALECLQSALNVLDKLNPALDQHGQLLIEVLTKLGDCNVVVGDYSKAVTYYEEVLAICKNFTGSSTLENNAHVLCMLGVANFLLGNHPKAVTMLETASILQRHIYTHQTCFEVCFTFTMLGSAFYKMRHYHRCIVWCLKASEPSLALGDKIETLDANRAWFLVQTFFTLGYAYYTLDFFEKGVRYLEIGRMLLQRTSKADIKQHVKLLKVLGDCEAALEHYDQALALYKEATRVAATLEGDERSSTALQNQLLNCMASLQVQARQYACAAQYLEQALEHQRAVESSIQGDLVGLQYKLGVTYTLSGDVDKAVDCFEECLQTLQHGGSGFINPPPSPLSPNVGTESVCALGRLGILYHVKGLMQDDVEYMEELLATAERHFSTAVQCEPHSSVCVQYANFLSMQGQPADALEVLLPILFCARALSTNEMCVSYSGVEQAILPEHLTHEADDVDSVVMETRVLAYFLSIVCCRQLGLTRDADDFLEAMYRLVLQSRVYFSWALMGYAFMEMGFYSEAAECFATAANEPRESPTDIPAINCCLCLYIHAYQVITKALVLLLESYVPENYICFTGQSTRSVSSQFSSIQGTNEAMYDYNQRTEQASEPSPMTAVNEPNDRESSTEETQRVAFRSSSLRRTGSGATERQWLENRDSGYFESDRAPSLSFSPSAVHGGEIASGSLARRRYSPAHPPSPVLAQEASFVSSHSSDSSYLTDQSMISDDRGIITSNESIATSSKYAQDVEIWETIDSKGNVLTSTVYEVENNGNYSDSEPQDNSISEDIQGTTNRTTRYNSYTLENERTSLPTKDQTTEMTSDENDDYNGNYRRLYESVQSAIKERWVNLELLDNETRNKLVEAGFIQPAEETENSSVSVTISTSSDVTERNNRNSSSSTKASPRKSVATISETVSHNEHNSSDTHSGSPYKPKLRKYLDNIPAHYRFEGSNSSQGGRGSGSDYSHHRHVEEELNNTADNSHDSQDVEQEEEEEVWEVFEEIVDTPPELLAFLAQNRT